MTVPDCLACGACCVDQVILLTEQDTRVPLVMRDGCFLRKQGGRCVALTGRIGLDPRCSIYEDRPRICRVMQPGVRPCHIMRASVHLEPMTEELVP